MVRYTEPSATARTTTPGWVSGATNSGSSVTAWPWATIARVVTLSLVRWRMSGSKPPSSRQARFVISSQPVSAWRVVQCSAASSASGTARGWRRAVPLAELAAEHWTTSHAETGWELMTKRACRELGGFDPDIRHRTNDSVTTLAIVAHGQAVTLLPEFVAPETHPGVVVRAVAEGSVYRTIFAATRTADSARPSVQALLAAVRAAGASVGWRY